MAHLEEHTVHIRKLAYLCRKEYIRFTVKRKSRSEHNFVIRAALGMVTQDSLLQQAALDLRYKIVIGYVELLPIRLSGGEGKRSLSSI